MPIANHAALRLREALDDYMRSISGDTGTRRRGGVSSRVNDEDRETFEAARALLGRLDGSSQAPAAQRNTPGARARDRAMQGTDESVNRGADLFPALRGGRHATNEPAGTPAGGGNQGGAQ